MHGCLAGRLGFALLGRNGRQRHHECALGVEINELKKRTDDQRNGVRAGARSLELRLQQE